MKAVNPGATVRVLCTTRHGFSSFTHNNKLFQVCGGIPAIEALEIASLYLASAHDLAVNGTLEECGDGANAVSYLIEFAKAIVDSVSAGACGEVAA